jgi:hypothetical protein
MERFQSRSALTSTGATWMPPEAPRRRACSGVEDDAIGDRMMADVARVEGGRLIMLEKAITATDQRRRLLVSFQATWNGQPAWSEPGSEAAARGRSSGWSLSRTVDGAAGLAGGAHVAQPVSHHWRLRTRGVEVPVEVAQQAEIGAALQGPRRGRAERCRGRWPRRTCPLLDRAVGQGRHRSETRSRHATARRRAIDAVDRLVRHAHRSGQLRRRPGRAKRDRRHRVAREAAGQVSHPPRHGAERRLGRTHRVQHVAALAVGAHGEAAGRPAPTGTPRRSSRRGGSGRARSSGSPGCSACAPGWSARSFRLQASGQQAPAFTALATIRCWQPERQSVVAVPAGTTSAAQLGGPALEDMKVEHFCAIQPVPKVLHP